MALLRHHLTVRLCIFLVFLLVLRCSKVEALDNGVALTPPMGWLQWERFACNTDCANDPDNCISEKLFMQMADCLAADGFKDVGYEFVNIDDCWASKDRDTNGNLQADPDRFPNGIKHLADYVHSKGLKLGIYGDIGTKTCGGYPGTENYIEKDANTFASWGVDMLKLDGCYASPDIYESGYPNMSMALNATGRHIVYSCSWPAYIKNPNYTKIAKYCNLWRNYDDINDSWQSVLGIIQHYASVQDDIVPFAGPGHWNDPDMIIAGDFGLSYEQQKAQFALWAIFAAPLLMSNDLRNLPNESKAILQNKEVIAVNQDSLGVQGRLIEFKAFKDEHSGTVSDSNDMVFVRPLSDKSVAVAMLNTAHFAGPHNITVDFQKAGVNSNTVMVRDLFEQQDLGKFTGKFSAPVNPTGVKLLLLKPASTD